jgi:hypothetical protein
LFESEMIMRWIVTLFVALFAGCAEVARLDDSLTAAPGCCRSFAEMTFRPLLPGEEARLAIDSNAPAFLFPEGKSYFAALKLPQREGGVLSVKTFLSSARLPAATVLMPQFVFLDSAHQPRRVEKEFNLKQDVDFFRGGYWSFEVPVSQDDAYVVVYADPSRFGSTTPRPNRSGGYAFATGTSLVMVPGTSRTFDIPWAAGGFIDLTLK